MYKRIIRPILFLFDPEKVHYFVFFLINIFQRIPFVSKWQHNIFSIKDTDLEMELFGIKFPNPVGLAAGFDKEAIAIDALANYGFAFIEIGTLTPKPQPGNPKKRLFRLKKDKGIINRMGFNNKGVEEAIKQLKKRKSKIIIGGNIGKNKETPNENAVNDYLFSFEALFDFVDYFVVNVSSPNTPNLRELQEKEPLTKLLMSLQNKNNQKKIKKPILLKIAPDLTDTQLLDIIDIVKETQIDGVIATNTTIERNNLIEPADRINEIGNGGLSGKPLSKRSTEVIRFLSEKSNKAFPIIGVGGIHSAKDAKEKLDAGADLIQVFTGFIYEGPSLVKKILEGLIEK
jgi:dihydroorotate dehydrogenase